MDRALRVGAGDCDVVNGVLAVILASAGIESRLAVGYVGFNGRVGELHAWVEYRHAGPWQVLDASTPPEDTARFASPLAPVNREPAPTPAAPPRGSGQVASRAGGRWAAGSTVLALGAAVCGVMIAGVILIAMRRRASFRHTQLDPRQELTSLLRGALEHPEAFASAPSVFERPLLPCHSGGLLSLGEAWRRASRRRLHGATSLGVLARRALRGSHRILDTRDADAHFVASSLGATDLDGWQVLVDRSVSSPLLRAAARHLSGGGWRLELRSMRVRDIDGHEDLAVLDLPGVTFLQRHTIAVVWNDRSWLPSLDRLFAVRPATATLRCAERVADGLGISDERRARWRSALARLALHEGES